VLRNEGETLLLIGRKQFLSAIVKRATLRAALVAIVVITFSQRAFAVTFEEALENCRTSVGRPIVRACMQSGGGPHNLERCRAQASPNVRQCVAKVLGGGGSTADRQDSTKERNPRDISKKEPTRKSAPVKETSAARGSVSDISPLQPDESRQPIALQDLAKATITSNSKYENTVKLKNGTLVVAHVTESLKINVVSDDAIEVEREHRRYDENDNLIGRPVKGTTNFELGKEKTVRGYDVVWKFEGSTLFYQMALVEGGYRTVIPLFKQNEDIKCVVMSGFSREEGTNPIKTIGADGSEVEILRSRKISSRCEVVKP
jgi:hypothetical protein